MADVLLVQDDDDFINKTNVNQLRLDRLRESAASNRNNPLLRLRECEIKEKFRLSSRSIFKLKRKIKWRIKRRTKRSFALSPLLQILICLRYLAGGCYLNIIADTLKVSRASVSRSVTTVCSALCEVACQYIRMPSSEAVIDEVKQKFKELAGMPSILGCVDGTFVRIAKPLLNPFEFVCRKMYHAINAQVCCCHILTGLKFI